MPKSAHHNCYSGCLQLILFDKVSLEKRMGSSTALPSGWPMELKYMRAQGWSPLPSMMLGQSLSTAVCIP